MDIILRFDRSVPGSSPGWPTTLDTQVTVIEMRRNTHTATSKSAATECSLEVRHSVRGRGHACANHAIPTISTWERSRLRVTSFGGVRLVGVSPTPTTIFRRVAGTVTGLPAKQ